MVREFIKITPNGGIMHRMFIMLNPGIYPDPKVVLVTIEIYGVGNGIVRQCSSWAGLKSLAEEFNGDLNSMPWPMPKILDWCIKTWGPVPY
jgi:hypothetical protein